MYERFISSSMLIGMRFGSRAFMKSIGIRNQESGPRARSQAPPWASDVQVPHVQRVVFDELPSRLDLVAHQRGEHLVRLGVVLGADLQQGPVLRVHRRRPERVWIHLAKALVAVDRDALLAGGDEEFDELVDGRQSDVGILAAAAGSGGRI